ncbi:futalosine hydrolase [Sphingobacterium sp. LRF_L2]|uniref:futalosine hydrolase n=1 Tax=Sphingobacterium sp. LRF_L2 TaxID=3369421 RepID=UPI003F629C93
MNTLVIAATVEEIQPSLHFLNERKIPYIITGVGMIASAYAITKAVTLTNPDLLIQVGIGGILDTEATLGSVYQIQEDLIFDFGAEDNDSFIPMDRLGFGKSHFSQPKLPDAIVLPNTKHARGITVNKVHGNPSSIAQLKNQYSSPIVESMEGASVFYVAEKEKIMALQFRGISNFVEPRNRESWQIGLAIRNLNIHLQEVIHCLA